MMNEFYNEKFFELLEEIKKDYTLVYAPRMLEYEKEAQKDKKKSYEFEELSKSPIEREVIRNVVEERLERLTYSSTTVEIELTEEQKILAKKKRLIRNFMRIHLLTDIDFEEFYKKYTEVYKNEKEEYIMSKSEVKKELQNIGFGVKVEYDINDEPIKYITYRYFNW